MSNNRYLLEIGVEEMPAAYLAQALKFSRKFWKSALKAKADVFLTSRRIAVSFPEPNEFSSDNLRNILSDFINQIPFPKRMKWDDSGIRFVRPIRWLLAIKSADKEASVLPLAIGKARAGNRTFYMQGMGFLKAEKAIDGIDGYFDFLNGIGVELSFEERKNRILEQSNKLAELKGCKVNVHKPLLDELAFLAEAPRMFIGRFDEKFLSLPFEVLFTSMAKNQKLFTTSFSEKAETAPYFIGMVEAQDRADFDFTQVINNVESVLYARLSDALFFWQQDLSAGLSNKVDGLKSIVLHEDIGSFYDKARVMADLAKAVAIRIGLTQEETNGLQKAAMLCKTDALTLMVYEFPELEGVMGYYYALKEGLGEEVALAIKEHYLPKGSDDDLPRSKLGAILSILDKVSHISGFFGAGIRPTGSEDPYGIRRAGLGIIRIMLKKEIPLLLDRLFQESIKLWGFEDKDIYPRIEEFFSDRIVSAILQRGIRRDIAGACVKRWGLDLFNGFKCAKALNKMAKGREFQDALKVLERTYKITKNAQSLYDVDESKFKEPVEVELWRKFGVVREEFRKAVESGDIPAAVNSYSSLLPVLHRYFEDVMVNVDEEDIRHNRLGVMQEINRLFTKSIAAFY